MAVIIPFASSMTVQSASRSHLYVAVCAVCQVPGPSRMPPQSYLVGRRCWCPLAWRRTSTQPTVPAVNLGDLTSFRSSSSGAVLASSPTVRAVQSSSAVVSAFTSSSRSRAFSACPATFANSVALAAWMSVQDDHGFFHHVAVVIRFHHTSVRWCVLHAKTMACVNCGFAGSASAGLSMSAILITVHADARAFDGHGVIGTIDSATDIERRD